MHGPSICRRQTLHTMPCLPRPSAVTASQQYHQSGLPWAAAATAAYAENRPQVPAFFPFQRDFPDAVRARVLFRPAVPNRPGPLSGNA